MDRKKFIRTTGISLASVLLSDFLFANSPKGSLISYPSSVSALLNDQPVKLNGKESSWSYNDLGVDIKISGSIAAIEVQANRSPLSQVTLHWDTASHANVNILNNHWERTYGDVSWHRPQDAEILPWYFMEYNGNDTNGFGVKTGISSFCFWQLDKNQLSLTMDTRCGGNGVQLGNRKIKAAEIVTVKSSPGESSFSTARRFMKLMCDKARMPKQPVYGINDWYFSYGNNSEKLIIEHTQMMAPMTEGLANRPFSVIDAGWFADSPSEPNDCCWGDNMDTPNAKFGDMARVAGEVKKIGMRPGIWTRPLCGSYKDPLSLMLPLIKGREEKRPVLDPSIPENLERIKKYFHLYNDWGYEMVKFDFTTFDILGKWGFEMIRDKAMSSPGWSMHDNSLTNAEIILNLYKAIREAAGKTYVISCNTISHLAAGIFELNRIGDDTSGNEWERTRKMGVNTLAFRGLQHGIFYAADPDCVGLTEKVEWEKNKQWMELVAGSGTPLFISAQPAATQAAQKQTIKECFRLASQTLPTGEPLDWKENPFPVKWKLNGKVREFNWA